MIAAMVVIMIGRKRSRQASKIACVGGGVAGALPLEREVDHHDRVLLDDADQHDDADDGDDAQILMEQHERGERAQPAAGRPERIVIGWMKLS